MNRSARAFIGLIAVVSFLLGLVVAGTRPPLPTNALPLPPAAGDSRPLTISSSANTDPAAGDSGTIHGAVDFGAAASRINAAVVNVDTASRGGDRTGPADASPQSRIAPLREGSGSGFIIDPTGYILTNYHVVTAADRVTVTLTDGRTFKADVVGIDPAMDVALLRIHSRDRLPVAPLGNSDTLRVGEWVCAISNPLGVYVHSVTVGVVSFLGRKLFDQYLDAYIQTDAAISPGSSGGPLINAQGQVVGITTAISAQASNIGFAIPISQIVAVLPQLRDHGTVARGYIGSFMTDLTPGLQRALRLGPDKGALVQDIPLDSIGERAGLRLYDVVVAADGHPIQSNEDLARYVASRQPGTITTLDVWREGENVTIPLKLRDRPLARVIRQRTPLDAEVRPVTQTEPPLGIKVRDLDPEIAERLSIPDTIQGVLVTDIDPAGPARLALLRPNMVILEINRRRVTTIRDYLAIVRGLARGEAVALLVYDKRTGGRMICTVTPDAEP